MNRLRRAADGDGNDDINFSATKANISTVFNYLRDHVAVDEQVLVFVTDHGSRHDDESYITLWGGSEILPRSLQMRSRR